VIRFGLNQWPLGLFQPTLTLCLTKEIIIPICGQQRFVCTGSNMTIMPALAAWSVVLWPGYCAGQYRRGLLFLRR
jgi:hypothetical protein